MKADMLDATWQQWLDQNLSQGCNPEELVTILLQNNFSLPAIRKAMGAEFPAYSPVVHWAGE